MLILCFTTTHKAFLTHVSIEAPIDFYDDDHLMVLHPLTEDLLWEVMRDLLR